MDTRISCTCPHCGVEEQYASDLRGLSVPCRRCDKPFVIALDPGPGQAPPPAVRRPPFAERADAWKLSGCSALTIVGAIYIVVVMMVATTAGIVSLLLALLVFVAMICGTALFNLVRYAKNIDRGLSTLSRQLAERAELARRDDRDAKH